MPGRPSGLNCYVAHYLGMFILDSSNFDLNHSTSGYIYINVWTEENGLNLFQVKILIRLPKNDSKLFTNSSWTKHQFMQWNWKSNQSFVSLKLSGAFWINPDLLTNSKPRGLYFQQASKG